MFKALFCTLIVLLALPAHANSFRFQSETLQQDVNIQVALPESYPDSDTFAYPIVYVLDGSTQFDHLVGTVRFLSTYSIIPEMIVVGVAANQRLTYFTPTEIEQFAGRSGQADRYAHFLFEELEGALAESYRIAPYRLVFGHSLSGLFTSYLALQPDPPIHAALSVSPSLWWDDFSVLAAQQREEQSASPRHWFVSMASEPDEMAEGYSKLLQSLARQPRSELVWHTREYPDETHDSTPLVAAAHGLRAIFQNFNAVPEIDVMPLAKLDAFYQAAEAHYGYRFPMSVHQYNVYGLKAAYEGQAAWGVEILSRGVEQFPESEILWDSLATALVLNSQNEEALVASRRALAIAEERQSKYLGEIRAQHRQLL